MGEQVRSPKILLTLESSKLMNVLLPRFIKSAYRKEPISSFVLIVGAINVLIGSTEGQWTLLSFGVSLSVIAFLVRWWQLNSNRPKASEKQAKYILPPSSSRSPLPVLSNDKINR